MTNPKATALRLLELEPGATPVQLKSAYRQAAMKTHPDKIGGSGIAFINVKRAYDYLVENGTELPKVQPVPANPNWFGGSSNAPQWVDQTGMDVTFTVSIRIIYV